MAIERESELYAPIKQFLQQLGYEVKSEIAHCDLVAYHADQQDEPVIVELKRSFSMPLLIQAAHRLALSDNVYVAVEQGKSTKRSSQLWRDRILLCRRMGVGLITVRFFKTLPPRVDVLCEPDSIPRRSPTRKIARLRQEFIARSGDYNSGGSTRVKLITAYREQSLYCAHLLSQEQTMSLKQLREKLQTPKVNSILQRNVYGWFMRESKGIYRLTTKGIEAVDEYATVIQQVIDMREGALR